MQESGSETHKGVTAASSVTPNETLNDTPASASTAGDDAVLQPHLDSSLEKDIEGKEVVASDEKEVIANGGIPETADEKASSTVVENTGTVPGYYDGTEKETGLDTTGSEGPKDAAAAEDEEVDESKYPGGVALGILTFGLMMATFVVALDNTIIGGYLPAVSLNLIC